MKKILAGVLAAASLLSMTVSASAATNEKKVAAAGEVEYDVAVTAPKVVLDLVMPAKMEAQLNPYGADIKLDTATTPTTITNGIAGLAYKIENKTEDYGVYIDATATTTVTRAVKTETWTVNKEAEAGTKGAALALVGGNTVAEIQAVADAAIDKDDPKPITESKAVAAGATDTDPIVQGALVMDSTVAAVTATKTPAGQTKQKKMMFVGAESEAYMAFIGDLAIDADGEWAEDDAINVALVLKVVAGPKTFSGSTTTDGGFTDPASTTGAVTADAGTLTRTGDNAYTLTGMTTSGGAVNLDLKLKTGYTATRTVTTVSGDACVTATATGKLTPTGDTGKVTVTYTILDDNSDPTGDTLVFTVEITA